MWKWVAVAVTIASIIAPFSPADATKLYIREYRQLGTQQLGDTPQVGQEPGTAEQQIDFTGGATQSAAFNGATRFVRVLCDVQCSVKFGTNPTATNVNMPLAAFTPEYFGVNAGDKVSVIVNP